jgi:hypothetical protein
MRARLRRYERLKYLYELDHPPFRTPEFPAHPSMTAWNAPIELQGSLDTSEWGKAWEPMKQPSVLREEDDEISPVLPSISLPPL